MYAIFEEVIGPRPPFSKGEEDAPHDAPPTSSKQQQQPRLYARAPPRLLHRPPAADYSDDSESVCSSNPLLDTISVLTYDSPEDDEDDYYYDLGEEEEETKKCDSVGYAGSSSIDSGYKSFCPTPEMPDPSVYTAKQLQRGVVKTRKSPSDPAMYDVNLDHLMYLRQSLLSAIQKCESSDPADDEQYLDPPVASAGAAAYTKTVRFTADLEQPTTTQNEPKKVQRRRSILKDPLCANLRSQLLEEGPGEAGAADCTLEEEIDSLLYGRAEFYDLESVDDFPCSYVTMIEEKYRSGKPSIAKVRKLKGDKSTEPPNTTSKPPSSAQPDPTPPPEPPPEDTTTTSPQRQQKKPPATVSITKTAKCRFTEVARCMLEIIEDLQTKKEQAAPGDGGPPPDPVPDPPAPPSAATVDPYAAAAEYHVYEEIDYDFLQEGPRASAAEAPPPLPARPAGMAAPPRRKPSPPPRKRGGTAEVRNRPKQRGNLYCLFADRVERRNISRSLEREWRDSGSSDNHEDDYGFKKDFPSI